MSRPIRNSTKTCTLLWASLLFAVSLAFPLSSIWAQSISGNDSPKKEVFVLGGGSFFSGNTGPGTVVVIRDSDGSVQQITQGKRQSIFSKAGRVTVGGRWWFTPSQAVEVSWSYAPNSLRWVERFPGSSQAESVSLQLHVNNIAFNYVWRFRPGSRLQPFLTTGAGIGFFESLTSTGGREWAAKFVLNFGAGADLSLTGRWALRFEIRDFFSGQPTGGFLQAPGGATHNLVPSAGFVFRF